MSNRRHKGLLFWRQWCNTKTNRNIGSGTFLGKYNEMPTVYLVTLSLLMKKIARLFTMMSEQKLSRAKRKVIRLRCNSCTQVLR